MQVKKQTVHLAVSYVDKLLSSKQSMEVCMNGRNFPENVLSAAFLLVATKFDEADDKIPLCRDILRCKPELTEGVETQHVYECEVQIVQWLDFDLNFLVPLHFCKNFLMQGVVFTTDKVLDIDSSNAKKSRPVEISDIIEVRKYISKFSDVAIKEFSTVSSSFKPS